MDSLWERQTGFPRVGVSLLDLENKSREETFLAEDTASPRAVRMETAWCSLRKHPLVWCGMSETDLVTVCASPSIWGVTEAGEWGAVWCGWKVEGSQHSASWTLCAGPLPALHLILLGAFRKERMGQSWLIPSIWYGSLELGKGSWEERCMQSQAKRNKLLF